MEQTDETAKTPFVVDDLAKIKTGIKAPYISSQISDLGGVDNRSILFTISLDPHEKWPMSILENSRYGKFHLTTGAHHAIYKEMTLEMFSGSLRRTLGTFRKTRVKSVDEAINKVNKYIAGK